MIQPDFREFQRLAKQGNLIPVYDVFPADLLTPVSAYLRLAQGARYSFLLESVEGGEKIARYTFAGANPEEVFRYAGGACVLESHNRIVWEERDPVTFLRARMERFRPVRLPGLPPLVAGAIGYFSYDMVRLIERIPKRLRDDIGLYDAMLMFYHGIIAFDLTAQLTEVLGEVIGERVVIVEQQNHLNLVGCLRPTLSKLRSLPFSMRGF